MPSILSKNCITSGIIDFYCLVCSSHFEYEADAYSHISAVKHKDALKLVQYVEKHKADLIRKIRGLYFCEGCDMIFPTATKVGLHINDPDHITQKRNVKSIVRRSNNILAFDNVLISDCAWNGIIDDTCILCNTEFDDKLAHVAEETHRLNLIKGKVVLETKDIIYRKIDNNLVQCLTCNELISDSAIVHHIDSAEHKNMYKLISNAENEDNDTKLYNTGAIKKTNVNTGALKKLNAASNETLNKNNIDGNRILVKDNIANASSQEQENTAFYRCSQQNDNDVKTGKSNQTVAGNIRTLDTDDMICSKLQAKEYIIRDEFSREWCIICDRRLDGRSDFHLLSTHHQAMLNIHKASLQNKQSPKSTDKFDLINLVDRYREEKINLNLIAETAICKICSKNVDFSVDAIERHIKQHKDSKTRVEKKPVSKLSTSKSNGVNVKLNGDPSSDGITQNKTRRRSPSDDADYFARKNALMRVPGDRFQRFYCKPCDLFVSPTLWNLKDHVYNTDHSENISKQNDPKILHGNPKKIPLMAFVTSTEKIEVDGFPFVLINNKYMVPGYYLMLISNFRNKLFMCQICDIDLRMEKLQEHFESEAHRNVIKHSLVVSSMPHEFIRELRYDKYHCGYCDKIESDWDDMLDHITIEEHYLRKLQCRDVLDQFQENRDRSLLQENNLNEFMMNFDTKRFNYYRAS